MKAPLDAGRIPVMEFVTNFGLGGTERQVVNIVRGLDRSRFDVHLGCFVPVGELLAEMDPALVPLTEYGITSLPSLRTLRQQGRLARYVRKHRVRIVHTFGFYPNVFGIPAARFGGAELVVASIRDTGDHLTSLQRTVQKWTCRWADHVLVNADAVKTVLVAEGYDPARVSVIRNGIDTSRFRGGADPGALHRELGLPASTPVVAVVARLNRLKGIEYFLEAAAELLPRFEDARFLIVGDDHYETYRRHLEEFSARLGLGGRVIFAGTRDDVPELLAGVSVSVLPSLAEGLSNAILEAMAAGVPVVATAVGGTPEIVEEGVTGLLVPPRDTAALARAIGSLLADPARARSMGEAGRKRVADCFSLEAMVRDTERFYERLLARRDEGRATSTVSLSRAEPARQERES